MKDVLDYTSDPSRRPIPWRHVLIATVFVLIAFCYAAAWMFGRGGRGEFSPDTLQSRYRSEALLPLTEIPLYWSSYSYTTDTLPAFLIANGYWTPMPTESPRWIPLFHENAQWRDGHTRLYTAFRRDTTEWTAWTKANPALAAHVWPKVLQSLRSGKADGSQEASAKLFVAQQSTDPSDFDRRWTEDNAPTP